MEEMQIPESFYFHRDEISQFVYVQVPLALIREKVFSGISDTAKLLYGLLLNRAGLSSRNAWADEHGRTYIIYTEKEAMKDFEMGPTKARKLFAELSNINGTGIGLIRKERVLNKPSKIYVMNFQVIYEYLKQLDEETSGRFGQKSGDDARSTHADQEINSEKTSGQFGQKQDKSISEAAYLQDSRKCDSRSVANTTHGQSQMRPTDSRKRDPRSVANTTHGQSQTRPTVSRENDPRSVVKATQYIKQDISKQDMSNHYPINPSAQAQDDLMDRMDEVRELIKENIEYDALCEDLMDTDRKKMDELIEIMVEACTLGGDMELHGKVVPHRVICSCFEKYNYATMLYVIRSLKGNKTEVKNVKKYLLVTLYNAAHTQVNGDNLDMQYPKGWG